MSYRVGLDIGTNSLGWSLVELRDSIPVKAVDLGVRIFSDGRNPKTGEPLAVERRLPRGLRRRRDRLVQRCQHLLSFLSKVGLMPEDSIVRDALLKTNPLELRSRATCEQVTPHELGRLLMHMCKRRGFKSNRKEGKKSEGKINAKRIAALKATLGERTIGQFLFEKSQSASDQTKPVSVRFVPGSDFYPTRDMYEHEFNVIKCAQEPFHDITENDWSKIHQIIFFQRPLKTPEVGRCRFEAIEPRAPIALPSFQHFRLLQDVNHFKVKILGQKYEPLNDVHRKLLIEYLSTHKEIEFSKIREMLELGDDDNTEINLQTQNRKKMKGDAVTQLLAGKKYFGKKWSTFSLENKDTIVDFLIRENDQIKVKERAVKDWALDEKSAQALSELSPDDFPNGYAPISAKVLRAIIPHLEKGLIYSEAVKQAGYNHSEPSQDGSELFLKYYGEVLPESVMPGKDSSSSNPELKHGKISNPTVHVALRQVEKVVNDLIKRYGKPAEIHIELARSLRMSYEEKEAFKTRLKENQEISDKIKKALEEQNVDSTSYENRLKYKLWLELGADPQSRCSVFSGKKISIADLFNENTIHIEHILPFSRTLDDSAANKTLAFAGENTQKGNKSPYEWLGATPQWTAVVDRARDLPKNKRWRFERDAMERFADENDFLARQLKDTQYLSKVARQYLTTVCPVVRISKGKLTALLRHHWALNSLLSDDGKKNRENHFHHAIDAVVIALTDTASLQRITHANQNNLTHRLHIPCPVEGLHDQVKQLIGKTIISHKVDHGVEGALFKDSIYGEVEQRAKDSGRDSLLTKDPAFNLVISKPIENLTEGQIDAIRDKKIRETLQNLIHEKIVEQETKKRGKQIQEFLKNWGKEHGIRSLRILVKDKTAYPIFHGKKSDGEPHKYFLISDDNLKLEVWKLPNREIDVIAVPRYEAAQAAAAKDKSPRKRPHPAAKLMFELFKGDTVKALHKGEEKVLLLVSIRPSTGNELIALIEHTDAKGSSNPTAFIQFKSFTKTKLRRLYVSPSGLVHDPGPVLG